ncbi:hypothetical protein ID0182_10900 [Helicobacter pylori]
MISGYNESQGKKKGGIGPFFFNKSPGPGDKGSNGVRYLYKKKKKEAM